MQLRQLRRQPSSAVAPLAMPGVLASVPKMLVDSHPLYLPWTYLPRAASWLWQFVASARPSIVAASAEKLAALPVPSRRIGR